MNSFRRLKEKYPNMIALPSIAYKEQKNRSRRLRLWLLIAAMRNSEEFCKLSIEEEYKYAVAIEKSCYDSSCQKCKEENNELELRHIYAHIIFIILTELDIKNNTYLLPKILANKISITNIGNMSQENLNSVKTREFENIIKERREVQLQEVFSYIYVCPACGANKSRPLGGQLASLDEQQATLLECANCLAHWTTYS